MSRPAPGITPNKQFAEILTALDGAKDRARAWTGNGFRLAAVSHASASKILSGRGSLAFGGRWNAAGTFPAVYCSLLPETAVTETMNRFRKTGLKARRPLPGVLVSLAIKLQSWSRRIRKNYAGVPDLRKKTIRQMRNISPRSMSSMGFMPPNSSLGAVNHGPMPSGSVTSASSS